MEIGYPGLMAALLACHFLGDFTPLSTPKMLEAKRTASPGWIAVHAGVHAVLVGVVVVTMTRSGGALVLAAVAIELGTHFGIDLLRARVGVRWSRLRDPEARGFWTVLGLDQLAHGLVLAAIAGLVLGT